MDDFWEYILNDLENMEYRIEDIILHSLTGIWLAIGLKIKGIFNRIRNFIN